MPQPLDKIEQLPWWIERAFSAWSLYAVLLTNGKTVLIASIKGVRRMPTMDIWVDCYLYCPDDIEKQLRRNTMQTTRTFGKPVPGGEPVQMDIGVVPPPSKAPVMSIAVSSIAAVWELNDVA